MTIGLFSFARIAMYHDLAPENWESIGGIEQHPALTRILAGTRDDYSNAGDAPAENHLDQPSELDVPLIADADSSQLAAIRDVLSGRNVVIEGPPGTGKSQTITNIIAAALHEGKTVLFLAEKMAALNVVKARLEKAGLGDFCLEIHSNKASRRSVLEALSRRINRTSEAGVDADLHATLAELRRLQQKLDARVAALAEPAGKLGITTQELFWRCHKIRNQTEHLPAEVYDLKYPDADQLTQVDVSRLASLADQFERAHTKLVTAFGTACNHPWYGVQDCATVVL